MKVCIQGADFETNNMGVSALAVGSVHAILHCHPEAEVFILSYEKLPKTYTIQLPERQVAVPLVNMRFSLRFWLRNNIAFLLFLTVLMKLLPFPALRRRWIGGNNCLRHLDESDLVLAISGGDSFSDIYGLARFFYVSLPQILALWAGKKLVLLPQTLGPFKSRLAQAVAKYVMKRAEAVYSRDRAGVKMGTEMLGANGAAPKLRFCYDVGFALDPIPPERVDVVGWADRIKDLGSRIQSETGAPLVGLNVSGLLFGGGYSRNNMFGLRVEYDKLMYDLIDFLICQKDADVLLIAHFFGQHVESDATVCGRVYDTLKEKYRGKIGWVRGSYDQSEIKYIIGQCDFFVGSRMHACIAAASQCVPAVSIAYSDKFIGVMETVGMKALVADARKADDGEILNIVDQAFERRGLIRKQLEQKIPQVREQVLDLFDEITGSRNSDHADNRVAAVAANQ